MLIYFLLPSLFLVVPLFLGLGILLCDNHFYCFHLPYLLFFGFIPLCQALGTLQRNTGAFVNLYFSFRGPVVHSSDHGFTKKQPDVLIGGVSRHAIRAGELSDAFLSLNISITGFIFFVYLYSIETIPMKT